MPIAQAAGARIHYEELGRGTPIVFAHEFGADLREWEAQLRFFSRGHRCIRYNARGYPPSEVPADPAQYGWEQARDDLLAVMDAAGVERAHVVGLSMGGYAALAFALAYPQRCLSIVPSAAGSGSILDAAQLEAWRQDCRITTWPASARTPAGQGRWSGRSAIAGASAPCCAASREGAGRASGSSCAATWDCDWCCCCSRSSRTGLRPCPWRPCWRSWAGPELR